MPNDNACCPMDITVKSGTSIEAIRIDAVLVAALLDGTAEQNVEAVKDWLYGLLRDRVKIRLGLTLLDEYVGDHVTEVS